MLDMRHAKPIVQQLERCGGADIVIVGNAIYEITARKLDTDTVQQAIRNLLEEKPHGND